MDIWGREKKMQMGMFWTLQMFVAEVQRTRSHGINVRGLGR